MKSFDRGLRSSGQPRLLAIDLDGTLLDPNGLVRPVVRDAIATVREGGVTVVLATGRSPMGAERVCLELGLTGPQISMNGAMFGSPTTGEVEWARTLEPDEVRSHLEFARAWGLSPTLCLLDGFAVELAAGATLPTDLPHFVVQSKLRVEPTLDSVAGDAVIRTYFPTGPDIHTTVVRALQARFGATASVVWADNLGVELLRRGTHKGRALAIVARSMGIAREETAAIGDGPNDLEMLRVAGISAAMRNAPPNVSFEATFVVPTSAEDGVVDALRRFYPDLPIPAVVRAAAPESIAQPEPRATWALPVALAESAA
jgi:Cof subfamily protein (haloacid dehalogenase superfamily)